MNKASDRKPLVTTQVSTAYLSEGGRRFFTRSAAYARTAIERIRAKRPCIGACEIDRLHGSMTGPCRGACEYPQHVFDRLVSRYAKALRKADNQANPANQRRPKP
jgi:predicted Fe-S protein YdhL (DUF1289 family)